MKIRVNQEEMDTKLLTYQELKQTLAHPQMVMIVNGFQTEMDLPIQEGDQFFFIEKGTLPPQDQLEAMMAARHTPNVHEKLKQGKVTIIGLGGLGSNIGIMLARIGVGYIRLIDFDVVEPSNLNRQQYYVRHIGMKKTLALTEQIKEINPFITVESKDEKVTRETVTSLTRGTDIVCEAVDVPEVKSMIVEVILTESEQMVVAASGMAGTFSANAIQTKRVRKRLYVSGDGTNAAQLGRGLMAPRVSVCAGHQANTILRLLIGEEDT